MYLLIPIKDACHTLHMACLFKPVLKIYNMKKILYIAFCLTALIVPTLKSNAQDNKFRIGLKAGLNFTNLYTKDDEVDKENMIVGFHGGAFFKIPVNERVGIQPEVLFSTQGAKYHYKSFFGGNDGDLKFRLNYVNVPVLLMVNLTEHVGIHIGPYFGILVSTKLTNDVDGGDDVTRDLKKDDFNTTDFGAAAGISADFDKVSIGARYSYGLNKVGKDRDFLGNNYRFPDARNSNIQVYISLSVY